MKKLNRVLSFIITVAMVLSMLPTFAMAAVGSTYTYNFNPTESKEVTYTTSTHTYDTTIKNTAGESVYSPWAYVRKHNQQSSHPKTMNFSEEYSMYTRSSLNGWIALKIRLPESGVYDAELFYTAYKFNGGFNIFLLPINYSF